MLLRVNAAVIMIIVMIMIIIIILCPCVSEGARCNMAMFSPNKHPSEDNCLLFHCPAEQDCPLMKAQDGTNTYDIYKGTGGRAPLERAVERQETVRETGDGERDWRR